VNREHLRAFLWLRWRLRVNQFRKAGALNAALFIAFTVFALFAAIGLLVGGFLVGLLALPQAPPVVRLLVWDGVIVAFLFFWSIGLLSDVQRSEGLAIDKVLHLPVSPSGAFLVNYLSSLASLTLIAFVPGMVGLILGEAFAGKPALLLALPLVAAFVLAVTAVTYQFQGWLASLMTNPRRRRTVIVLMTAGFILLMQLPNLLNVARMSETGRQDEGAWTRLNEQRAAAEAELKAKKISQEAYQKRWREIKQEYQDQLEERTRRRLERVERTARLASLILPPGWLALGAAELASANVVPALLGTLGLGLIGASSLWRAYRTTLRLYTGEFTSQGRRATLRPEAPADPNRVRLLEWKVPWVSEHASAVALAAFRSLMRAPEAKMALLAPLILVVVFGGVSLSARSDPPAMLRPLTALGAGVAVLLICGVQLIGNQFGYDRGGFRAYVLSPVPRREILLGKNLAVAPLALGMALLMLLLVGAVYPMRFDHYPAAVAQLLAAFLLFCLLANTLSILAPIPLAAGSLQPAKVKAVPILLQMVFLGVLPLAMIPVLIPVGVEVLLAEFAGVQWPVSLVLSLLVLTGTVFLYRAVLTWEGELLAAREQAVLEAVTSKGE
jgi:ABC-2 type transport system permease protein